MGQDLQNLLSEIEELIRRGAATDARKRLSAPAIRKASREDLVRVSALARRAGLADLALRLLRPYVIEGRSVRVKPLPAEIASYAMSLANVGAVHEAAALLRPLAKDTTPEVQLFSGLVSIHQWEYKAAALFFETYLTLPGTTAYQKKVAELNLCSCYSFSGQTAKLLARSEGLVRELIENRWWILARDAELLRAQAHIQNENWQAASEALDRAGGIAVKEKLDDFFRRKWKWALSLASNGPSAGARADADLLRVEASRRRLWEAVRDFDSHWALAAKDQGLAQKVYFGSPYPSYRRRLAATAGSWLSLPEVYEHSFGQTSGPLLDLTESGDELAVRVLRAMTKDFYHPLRTGGLFSEIYPGEFFNPDSSPGRVRTALTRTRQWLERHDIPLVLNGDKNGHWISTETGCRVLVATDYGPVGLEKVHGPMEKLRQKWPHHAFSTEAAATILSFSPRKTRRLLLVGTEEKILLRIGTGRGTQFRFAK